MAKPSLEGGEEEEERGKEEKAAMLISRKDKRKERKRMKRKQARREMAEKEREEEERRQNDPEEQRRVREMEEEERQRMERERMEFQERERLWMEAMERKRKEEEKEAEEEEQRRKILEEEEEVAKRLQVERETEGNEEDDDDDDWEYVEEGPPEIIWQGNEIILRKKKVRVPKKNKDKQTLKEDVDRPTSNPLPPESEAFVEYQNPSGVSAQRMPESLSQKVPLFGSEQDKAHCPFHFKTGACRFGLRCSRVHFYPDKACTLLIKNMYNGPGLLWEQDEGLEYTDEEVERCYEEFYEDVHTEFLKYGEIMNFKTCRNGLFHLRGNVYVHYKSLDSAVLAFQSVNGRYFAGRQIKCEFVNLTRWRIAICGEFMKTRLQTCSRGMACNFLHCFCNPGGDYEWADWDKPPPKYWVRKMASLFGYSDESAYEKPMEQEKLGQMRTFGKTTRANTVRHHARRSRSREVDHLTFEGHESDSEEGSNWQRGTNNNRKEAEIHGKHPGEENRDLKRYRCRDRRSHESEYDGDHPGRDIDRERENDRHRHHSRKRSNHHGEVSECSTGYQINESWIEKVYSDEEWLDGGRNGDRYQNYAQSLDNQTKGALDSNSVLYESDACHSERDRDGEQGCSHRERGSRRQCEVQSPDSSCTGEWQLYGGRDKDSHQHHRSISSVHQKSVLGSPDDCWDDRYRGHGMDYRNDWLDRDRGRGHSCTRKRSRDSEPWSSDDELSPKRLKEKFHSEKSKSGRSLLSRNPTVGHSRRRNHSSRESGEAELHEFSEVDKYHVTSESIDPGSRWKTVDAAHIIATKIP